MSGGSYDYLCWARELDDLLTKEHHLEAMADRLAALGYAEDAARETQELLVQLRQWRIRAQVKVDRLEPVWKAIEWRDSGDWSEDSIRQAVVEYRGDQ